MRPRLSRMTRNKERRRGSPVRSVSCGLSARMVPLPVIRASHWCRSVWPHARDSSDVIHRDSPTASGDFRIESHGDFQDAEGAVFCLVDDEGFIEMARFVSENAGLNLDAGGPKHRDAPAVHARVGILDRAQRRAKCPLRSEPGHMAEFAPDVSKVPGSCIPSLRAPLPRPARAR